MAAARAAERSVAAARLPRAAGRRAAAATRTIQRSKPAPRLQWVTKFGQPPGSVADALTDLCGLVLVGNTNNVVVILQFAHYGLHARVLVRGCGHPGCLWLANPLNLRDDYEVHGCAANYGAIGVRELPDGTILSAIAGNTTARSRAFRFDLRRRRDVPRRQ